MAYKIEVENYQEFEDLIYGKNFQISEAIVDRILDNLDTSKRFIPVLEIAIMDEDKIMDLTVDRKDFLDTLEKNLEIHIFHEQYERCVDIKKAIDTLNSKL